MADLGKNGYKWTGYSEPFIVPDGVTVTAGGLSAKNFGVTGINGAVPIEYTEYKNAGLYVRANETVTGTSFKSKDLNIDTRQDATFLTQGKWIITDDDGTTFFTIDDITPVDPTIMDSSNEKGEYTITVSAAFDAVVGIAYRVVARQLDLCDAAASRTYTAGEKIVEVCTPEA